MEGEKVETHDRKITSVLAIFWLESHIDLWSIDSHSHSLFHSMFVYLSSPDRTSLTCIAHDWPMSSLSYLLSLSLPLSLPLLLLYLLMPPEWTIWEYYRDHKMSQETFVLSATIRNLFSFVTFFLSLSKQTHAWMNYAVYHEEKSKKLIIN